MTGNELPLGTLAMTRRNSVLLRKHWATVLVWGLSYLFFHAYAKFVFVLYLAHNGFFSYDFLQSSEYGYGWFFVTAEVVLLLVSMLVFGWILTYLDLLQDFRRKDPLSFYSLRFGSMSFFGLALVLQLPGGSIPSSQQADWVNSIATVALKFSLPLCIALYLASMLTTSGTQRVWRAFAFGLALIVLSFFAREQLSKSVGAGLKVFGAGGMVAIKVYPASGGEVIEGKLVLHSPQNLYVRAPNSALLTVVPIDKVARWAISP